MKFHIVFNNRPINWGRTRKEASRIARDMENKSNLPKGTFHIYKVRP